MLYLKNDDALQFQTRNTAVALGKFDGVHLGHQFLIEKLLEEKMKGRQTLVFTFSDSPSVILGNGFQKNIYTYREKVICFSELGIDILLEYPFTKEFAACEAETFVTEYLVKQLGVKSIYVGEDFRFGKGRIGNVALLEQFGREYNFEVNVIPKKTLHGKIISSTAIRNVLESSLQDANEMLGRPYFIYGNVVHGQNMGASIGYPTANQKINKHKLVPTHGVYATRVEVDGCRYNAISNLGMKPTIDGKRRVGLETHILNFSGDLYDKYLKTELLYFVREEQQFDNVDKLKKQIADDIEFVTRAGFDV